MHKNPLFAFGAVSMLSLLTLFAGYQSITGLLVEESLETYELGTEVLKHAPRLYPSFSSIQLAMPGYDPATLPPRELLTPEFINFQVDSIAIYPQTGLYYLPIDKNRIHTYSGTTGYYAKDPRTYVQGYLCAYAHKVMGAPLHCEQALLSYHDGMLTFANGYPEDEYIGRQAVGTDWAALWILANPEYGILASSPVAHLRFFG